MPLYGSSRSPSGSGRPGAGTAALKPEGLAQNSAASPQANRHRRKAGKLGGGVIAMPANAMELMICGAARLLEDGRDGRRRHRRAVRRGHARAEDDGAAPDTRVRGRRRRPALADHADQRRRLAHLLPGADGHQHGRRHGDLPARHDRLHLPRRGPDRRLRQPQLDHDRRRLPAAQGPPARQRRRQRPGLALLADPGRHQARPAALRREARLPHHARLPDRARAPARPPACRPAPGPTASSPTWQCSATTTRRSGCRSSRCTPA